MYCRHCTRRRLAGNTDRAPVNPQYLISQSQDKVILRNYEGIITTYAEPADKTSTCHNCGFCGPAKHRVNTGLGKLINDDKLSLIPKDNNREKRQKALLPVVGDG